MPPQEVLFIVFCLIDDEMKARGRPKLRRRTGRPYAGAGSSLTAASWTDVGGGDRSGS